MTSFKPKKPAPNINEVTVLTVSDLHQSRKLFEELAQAVKFHKPNLIAVVGDCLHAGEDFKARLTVQQCADILNAQPSEVLFVRGNHEDENWVEFAKHWRRSKRPLHALNGEVFRFGPLINHIKNPPFKPGSLDPYLDLAITSRDTQSVQILIAAGADPKPETHQPVKTAASVGSVAILRILEQHGADLCAHNSDALVDAIYGGHVETLKYLIGAGANVNADTGSFLIDAMKAGDAEILETLLQAGAKLDHPSQITSAIIYNTLDMLLLLEHYGCAIQPYADDLAALAIDRFQVKTLEYILNNFNVSPKILDDGLELAARDPGYPLFKLLIKHHADASTNHSAALKRVIVDGAFGVARLLLNAGAQISDLDSSSVAHVLRREKKEFDREFLITLLQQGVTVAGLNLDEVLAVKFFNNVRPEIILRDNAGNYLPKKIRDERQTFVRITAKILNGHPKFTGKTELACWVATFLADFQSSAIDDQQKPLAPTSRHALPTIPPPF